MHKSKKDWGALASVAGVGVCFGTTPLWVNLAHWDVIGTVWARALLCTIILGSFILVVPKERRSIFIRPSWRMFAVGFTGWASMACFAAAFFFAAPATVYLFFYSFPILSLAVEIINKERKLRIADCVVVLCTIAGIRIFFHGSSTGINPLGAALAVGSAVFWVVSIQLAKGLRNDDEGKRATIIGQTIGSLCTSALLLPMLIRGDLHPPTSIQLAALIGLGACAALGMYLWGKSFRRVPGHISGALTVTEAPIGSILVYWFLGTSLTGSQIAGAGLVLIAAILAVFDHRENEAQEAK